MTVLHYKSLKRGFVRGKDAFDDEYFLVANIDAVLPRKTFLLNIGDFAELLGTTPDSGN